MEGLWFSKEVHSHYEIPLVQKLRAIVRRLAKDLRSNARLAEPLPSKILIVLNRVIIEYCFPVVALLHSYTKLSKRGLFCFVKWVRRSPSALTLHEISFPVLQQHMLSGTHLMGVPVCLSTGKVRKSPEVIHLYFDCQTLLHGKTRHIFNLRYHEQEFIVSYRAESSKKPRFFLTSSSETRNDIRGISCSHSTFVGLLMDLAQKNRSEVKSLWCLAEEKAKVIRLGKDIPDLNPPNTRASSNVRHRSQKTRKRFPRHNHATRSAYEQGRSDLARVRKFGSYGIDRCLFKKAKGETRKDQ